MIISIIGGGSFGTALGNILSSSHQVILHVRNVKTAKEINVNHINSQYFPAIKLNTQLKAVVNYDYIGKSDVIILAIPSKHILEEFNKIQPYLNKTQTVINTAKGFTPNGKTVLQELRLLHANCFSILGPTFASNLIKNEYSAFTVASDMQEHYKMAINIFSDTNVILDYSRDYELIEMASILKNVFAIANGLFDSIDDSVNTKYVFLTQSFKEMMNILSVQFDGINQNYTKNAVFGDLLLTSQNDQSRNKTLGQLIGRGFYSLDNKSSITFEGIRSSLVIQDITKKHDINTPIVDFTCSILNGKNVYQEFNKCLINIKNHHDYKGTNKT